MELSLEEISELLEAVAEMDVARVEIEVGDVRLVVDKRHDAAAAVARSEPPEPAPAGERPVGVVASGLADEPVPADAAADGIGAAGTAGPAGHEMDGWLARAEAGEITIVRAPMVGTFYRAKEPGAPPFTDVGAAVAPGDVVGLIEVMKLFHSISAGAAGVVERILVEDGQLVEHDQPLVIISHS